MNEERDRFLTEAMGMCWHDFDPDDHINTYSSRHTSAKSAKVLSWEIMTFQSKKIFHGSSIG